MAVRVSVAVGVVIGARVADAVGVGVRVGTGGAGDSGGLIVGVSDLSAAGSGSTTRAARGPAVWASGQIKMVSNTATTRPACQQSGAALSDSRMAGV